ncbi:MAG: hypothetical protein HC771_15675 [Synechococcales cyanobacterium CRU_2_2]|nr:hypothetical protein [Synechococcales cyanobacterium CRU_2_2]
MYRIQTPSMEYIEILKDVIKLLILILSFAPLAAEMPLLLPLSGLIALLVWLNQQNKPQR